MLDRALERNCEHTLSLISEPTLRASELQNSLEHMAEVFTREPHASKLRDLGVSISKDPRDISTKLAIAAHLAKLFKIEIQIDQAHAPLEQKVMHYIDETMSGEVAHALRIGLDRGTKTRLKKYSLPVLSLARQIDEASLRKSAKYIKVPTSVIERLGLSPDFAKNFTSQIKYTFSEITTLLKKDLGPQLDTEINDLALPLLYNLPEIYIQSNASSEANPKLFDKINTILWQMKLISDAKIVDKAALIYYCIKHSQLNIEQDTRLIPETREALLKITNGAILTLINKLRVSPHTDFTFMRHEGALKKLQEKVSAFDPQFQNATIEDLIENSYHLPARPEESMILDKDTKGLNEKIGSLKEAVAAQWIAEPEFAERAHDKLIELSKAANLVGVIPNIDSVLLSLKNFLELASDSGDCKHLVLDSETCAIAFLGLQRYARRFEGSLVKNITNILQEFLKDESKNDLREFLNLNDKDVFEDKQFSEFSKLANKLKLLKRSMKIQIGSPTANLEPSAGEKTFYFGQISKAFNKDSLILAFEYIDTNKFFQSIKNSVFSFGKGIAIAAYSILQKLATARSMTINDFSDDNLIDSIKDNKYVKPLQEDLKKLSARKLLITILDDIDNGYKQRAPKTSPSGRKPSPTPQAA